LTKDIFIFLVSDIFFRNLLQIYVGHKYNKLRCNAVADWSQMATLRNSLDQILA